MMHNTSLFYSVSNGNVSCLDLVSVVMIFQTCTLVTLTYFTNSFLPFLKSCYLKCHWGNTYCFVDFNLIHLIDVSAFEHYSLIVYGEFSVSFNSKMSGAMIVGPHRERRGICISLNRTPAGVALSHWGQINRAIMRLNTPHFTASCSFAVKHCCTLRPQGMSDWQGLFWFGYVRVQSCWRVHLQLLLYRYHLKSVNPIWWYCAWLFSSFFYDSWTS